MVLGVEVPLQDPLTLASMGKVMERGEHSWRQAVLPSLSWACISTRVFSRVGINEDRSVKSGEKQQKNKNNIS